MTLEFEGFEKIPRLSRQIVITEKIDGTNAQIYISEDGQPITLESGQVVPFLCGSRNRWVFPENDNRGFARWAYEHVDELLTLGPGRHFGEWWGQGIQRGYGLTEKRFSLFNTGRWITPESRPACCDVVPILGVGEFSTRLVADNLLYLKLFGSRAAPGFMNPEGVVIYHAASRSLFKKTILGDEKPKGSQEEG